MPRPLLSVVIPAYNESGNFKKGLLNPVYPFLSAQKYSWEVILVNDGSTDDTSALLNRYCRGHRGFRLLNIAHGGKSAAVTAGVLNAKGRYILFTDFDQSTPIQSVSGFLTAHQAGADVVIGVRGGNSSYKSDSLMSKLRSKIFLLLVQVIALPGIYDSQCGFKSFSALSAKKIFTSLKVCRQARIKGGYMGAFDVEALFLARKYNYHIAQVPVNWIRVPSTHLNVWKEPMMMVRDTLKIRLYGILNKYD